MVEIKELLSRDRAVSPVIGVILMVAITVILAATAGVFVVGFSEENETTPQTNFQYEFDKSDQEVVVRHGGGTTLNEENSDSITVKVIDNSPGTTPTKTGTFSVASGVSAGTTMTVENAEPGDEIEIYWTSPDGETRHKLSDHVVGS